MQTDAIARHQAKMIGSTGPVVVLAHGVGGDQASWRFIVPELVHSHRVLVFDHVGCGRSDTRCWTPQHHTQLSDYQRDVTELLDAFGLDRVSFVGHSVSGSIGALIARSQPGRIERLVMVSACPSFVNDAEYEGGFERDDIEALLILLARNRLEGARFLAPLALGGAGSPALVDDLHRGLGVHDPAIALRFAEIAFRADIRALLPEVMAPTWVLQCTDDALVPRSVGPYLQARLPHATLRELRASGHCPHLTHPQELAEALRECLSAAVPIA